MRKAAKFDLETTPIIEEEKNRESEGIARLADSYSEKKRF